MSSKSSGLDWGFWDAQLEAYDALESGEYDLVTLRTGYGGGKTVFGARWTHLVSMNVPNSHNLVLAPSFQKGGPATYSGFFEELPGENTVPNDAQGDPENSPVVAGYNHNEKRLTYKNGSIARLGSADSWNRYAGSEFNAIWCDEVSHYGTTSLYDLHEMLVSRQRTKSGPNVTLWTSTGNGYNDFYDITERQVQPDGEGGEESLPWKDRMKVIVGSSLDNPFLNEKEKMVGQFKGTSRETQALHGGFAAAQGLVYGSFNRNTHVVQELPELRPERYYAYDHGWKDPRVLLEVAKTTKDQYIVLDEYYETKRKLSHAKEWLESKDKGTIYAEHEPEHQQEFRDIGFDVEPAIKDLDEGIPVVREFLDTDENGVPGFLVYDECTNLIQEFGSYKEEDVGKSKAEDHALDCCRYLLATRELEEETQTGAWTVV